MAKVNIPLLSFVAISSKNIQQHTSRVNIHRIVATQRIAVAYLSVFMGIEKNNQYNDLVDNTTDFIDVKHCTDSV